MKCLPHIVLIAGLLLGSMGSAEADWLSLPSRYTHDPLTGERVNQFAAEEPAFAPHVSNFRSSGHTHIRSSIQFNQSSDNYHRVEEWGDPVRPYGEWRFPYRPYSVPYPAWGAPFAGLGDGFYGRRGPRGGFGGPGAGNPPGHGDFDNGQPFNPYPPLPDAGQPIPPYYDGSYPSDRRRLDDEQFFQRPPE